MNKISVFQKMEMKFTSYFIKIFSFFERYTFYSYGYDLLRLYLG